MSMVVDIYLLSLSLAIFIDALWNFETIRFLDEDNFV